MIRAYLSLMSSLNLVVFTVCSSIYIFVSLSYGYILLVLLCNYSTCDRSLPIFILYYECARYNLLNFSYSYEF